MNAALTDTANRNVAKKYTALQETNTNTNKNKCTRGIPGVCGNEKYHIPVQPQFTVVGLPYVAMLPVMKIEY